MRKKYLSALLFGALLVASAGTFTSCKDYDDDINNLEQSIQNQKTELDGKITALESSISSLQAAQNAIDTKIAEVQDAAEKAALEAQKQAIATASAELQSVKEELEKSIANNASDIEALKAASASVEEKMTEVVGRIEVLEAFQVSTTETIDKLNQAVTSLQNQITSIEQNVAENAEQIGKNKASIEAQIKALEEYKASNDEALQGKQDQIDQLIADLKELEAGQLTEAKVNEIAAKVTEELNGKLSLLEAAFNKKVTHVSLAIDGGDYYAGPVSNGYGFLPLYLKSMEAVTDETFGEGLEGAVSFKKGNVETYEDKFMIRVSPTNASLDKNSIKLVNSQLGDLKGLVDVVDLQPYTGLLSRGVSANGLWEVTVKLQDNFDMEKFIAAAYTETGKSIQYAVMVGDSAKDERQVVSEYSLLLNGDEKVNQRVINLTVNDTPINQIHNRFNYYNNEANGWTESGSGTKVPYVEQTWNMKREQVMGNWNYVYAPWAEPIFSGNNCNTVAAAYNVQGSEQYDERNGNTSLRVKAGEPFEIKFASEVAKNIRAYYVTFDEQCAVESAPSELQAWKSYKQNCEGLKNMDKVFPATETITLSLPEEANGDYIGFRVYAVNYDGSLVDPDGRAFYVYVGELSELSASLTLSMDSEVVTPRETTVKSEAKDFNTSSWTKATEGSYYSIEVMDEEGNDVTTELGISAANFKFTDGEKVITVLNTWGTISDKADEAKTIQMVDVPAVLMKDDVTYTAKITIKGDNNSAAILAVATITFTKELPGFPSEDIAPFTNMLQNNTVMIFPINTNGVATYDMKNVWHGIDNQYAWVASENEDVNYELNTQTLSVKKDYVNPDNESYGDAVPMDIVYAYGFISQQLNTTTGGWDLKDHQTNYGGFNVIFGNYVNECNVTFDSKFEQTYPGAVGVECYIPLSSLTIKDWYNAAVDLTKLGTAGTKENTYIEKISSVNFITDNPAKPVDEYYAFSAFVYKSTSEKYYAIGQAVNDTKDTANYGKTVDMSMCNTIKMISTSSASTGATVQTKIRFTLVDKFGYSVELTSENSFPMKFQK